MVTRLVAVRLCHLDVVDGGQTDVFDCDVNPAYTVCVYLTVLLLDGRRIYINSAGAKSHMAAYSATASNTDCNM